MIVKVSFILFIFLENYSYLYTLYIKFLFKTH